jgi:hypothetical protein
MPNGRKWNGGELDELGICDVRFRFPGDTDPNGPAPALLETRAKNRAKSSAAAADSSKEPKSRSETAQVKAGTQAALGNSPRHDHLRRI